MPLPLWGFAAVTVPLVMSPGPSTAVVLRNSIAGGSVTGLMTVLGANSASCCYGVLTAFGFGAALQRWPSVATGLRWGGVAYLLYLAVRSFIAAFQHRKAQRRAAAPASPTGWHGLTSGFLTNALNPSLSAFYLIVIPQFIPPSEPFARSALILTALHVSLAASWHTAWVITGTTLSRALSGGRPRQVLDLLTATALALLAAKLTGLF